MSITVRDTYTTTMGSVSVEWVRNLPLHEVKEVVKWLDMIKAKMLREAQENEPTDGTYTGRV